MTTMHFTVSDADTAIALASGDVPVLATPRLLAWMEAATVAAAADRMVEGRTSVGVDVAVRHRRASAVGAGIDVEVLWVAEEGSTLVFTVVAREQGPRREGGGPAAVEVASGRIVRAVVRREAFLSRLPAAAGRSSSAAPGSAAPTP